MGTNQGDRQASVRSVTGTALTYEGDWHALFTQAGIPLGDFNGRMLAWINGRLGANYKDINGAMAAFAANQGVPSWGAMGAFDAAGVPAAPVNTTAPAIYGSPYVGSTLTADRGLWTGSPAPTFAYQWKKGGVNVSGATGSTYVPVSGDIGGVITVTVTATNSQAPGGVSATSAGTAAISAALAAPVNTVAPTISGSAVVGSTLTASTGTWTGNPTPTYTYQWTQNGVNISGANGSTYNIVLADNGTTVSVTVTATNSQGTATATATGVVVSSGATVNGIVIGGDSLMAGATTTNGPMSALYASYTTQSATSRAISGETLATMDANYATDYAPYYNASTANTLVSEGGINDILAGATLAQLQTRVQSIASKARTTGFIVCVSTIARASTSGPYGYTAGMETIRQNYNTWMRANYTSFADRLLDLDNIPALADPTNTAYFNSDMLHWTNLSNSFVADVIRTTLGVAARPDTVPEAFTFSDLTGATPSTAYTSNTITVIGINGSAAVSITGGTYSKNGGAFTSSAGTAVNGDTFVVKGTSSASNSSAVDVTLTIGGVSDTYTITTAAGGAASLWSASDASAMNFTLTSGGLVAQKNTPASYNPLRSNSSKATGKLYIEFKATAAGTNAFQIFGFCNAGFVLTAGTYLGTGSSGASIGIFGTGAGVQGGFTSASVARIKNANATIGDINMFAVDLDSGFGWVGFDGTWGASGNPATGANPAFYWTPASVGALYAAMSAYDGSEGAWKICADAASQTYAAPTGFSAWG